MLQGLVFVFLLAGQIRCGQTRNPVHQLKKSAQNEGRSSGGSAMDFSTVSKSNEPESTFSADGVPSETTNDNLSTSSSGSNIMRIERDPIFKSAASNSHGPYSVIVTNKLEAETTSNIGSNSISLNGSLRLADVPHKAKISEPLGNKLVNLAIPTPNDSSNSHSKVLELTSSGMSADSTGDMKPSNESVMVKTRQASGADNSPVSVLNHINESIIDRAARARPLPYSLVDTKPTNIPDFSITTIVSAPAEVVDKRNVPGNTSDNVRINPFLSSQSPNNKNPLAADLLLAPNSSKGGVSRNLRGLNLMNLVPGSIKKLPASPDLVSPTAASTTSTRSSSIAASSSESTERTASTMPSTTPTPTMSEVQLRQAMRVKALERELDSSQKFRDQARRQVEESIRRRMGGPGGDRGLQSLNLNDPSLQHLDETPQYSRHVYRDGSSSLSSHQLLVSLLNVFIACNHFRISL